MASSSAALVLALFLSLGVGHILGQPTTLTVAGANSTATPRQFGAPTLDILFEPPVVQVTGVVQLDVIACGLGGLPTNVAIVGTNITSAPPVVTVSATARGGSIGAVTISGFSVNLTAPAFPVNQTDGSYNVSSTGGSARVGRVNGTLRGNSFDLSDLDVDFVTTPDTTQLFITGSFKSLPLGLIQMSATPGFVIPLSQIVAAAGYSSSTLVQADTSGGSIQIPVSILADGPDPCPS